MRLSQLSLHWIVSCHLMGGDDRSYRSKERIAICFSRPAESEDPFRTLGEGGGLRRQKVECERDEDAAICPSGASNLMFWRLFVCVGE